MSCFLTNSSLGKKLVMSVTGCFLVLFILFHMSMNITLLFSPEAYNMVCEFLGANWYALVGTVILVAGIAIHFIYALMLTVDNYRARGKQRYAVTVKEKGVEWASKNMLLLGWIIIGGLALHLIHFWSKMQLVEIMGSHYFTPEIDGTATVINPANGALLVAYTFSKWYNVLIYILWLAALWFHLTHGVWSMFQSVGWANDTWYPRLKCIAKIVATLVLLGFAVVLILMYLNSGDIIAQMSHWVPEA
ncbi:MAG: succinate dehydrogenase cytochrome b subunit [Alistipes sp.]|nr:succinate dehydrogenase cytochrome b subunit [Alistipes sp.]